VAGKAPVCLPPLGFHVSQITARARKAAAASAKVRKKKVKQKGAK
jgi:hypothetical protein